MKKFVFTLVLLASALAVVTAAGEWMFRRWNPQPTLYPRYQFSREYGLIPFAETVMTHEQPGRFRFTYHINALHHRGRLMPPADDYPRPNLVVLGDSYAFGMGVAEGAEFPVVLGRQLQDRYTVVNLAAPGWGLTQQIRRYEELGRRYRPAAVILQFCRNDPEDNLVYPVTRIEGDRFVFRDSDTVAGWPKRYLSRSRLQRSQLYNFFRNRMADRMNEAAAQRTTQALGESSAERLYIDLLRRFAGNLKADGARLLFIAPQGQLDEFPRLRAEVERLDRDGELTHLDTRGWMDGPAGQPSPEGHVWGAAAHAVVAGRLAALFPP
jgi:hypothetical protein